ncbi:MAG TPA: trypsin-like peptidase domain-containing protein [Candidatus Saccharimonadales bacterium]
MEGSNSPATRPENHHFWMKVAFGLAVLITGFVGGALAVRLYDQNLNQDSLSGGQTVVDSESQAISDIVNKVGPSVVSIQTETIEQGGFFSSELYRQEGAGTGIIVDTSGLVLTNRHVIPENVSQVNLVLADGTIYEDVEVVDRDPLNDIAFLKINNPQNLVAAPLGDSSKMKVGDKVVAIGNALGEFSNTVTFGIISGLGRPIVAGDGTSSQQLNNLFQTDAAINPGNSGGPLVNLDGEVIGVNTAVAGGAENIGFAIPINDVKPVIASVKDSGKVIRPYLGVRYVTLTPGIAKEAQLEQTQGAYIIGSQGQPGVIAGSPADKAGIEEEDIIVSVNGQVVNAQNPLSSRLGVYKPEEKVILTVVRDGQEQTIEVVLGTLP